MCRSLGLRLCAVLVCVASLSQCGGNSTASTSSTGPSPAPATPAPSRPTIQHIVVVVEENHSYESVIGGAEMPYLNSLANRYALATAYYADTHPSIGDYFMLTTGQIITNDDAYTGTVPADNVARILNAAGKSWKVYAESLPSAGYLGGDQFPYLKHHNPFAYFSDVVNDPAQAKNIVPFTHFATDLAAGTLPHFAFVVPDAMHDAHDGTLSDADNWLRTNIDPLLNHAVFQQTGLLFIVFDESFFTDTAHGGGHVAAVMAGSMVKSGYRSATFFQHGSALRLFLDALGIGNPPGAAAGTPSMSEMLQ